MQTNSIQLPAQATEAQLTEVFPQAPTTSPARSEARTSTPHCPVCAAPCGNENGIEVCRSKRCVHRVVWSPSD